MKLIRQLEKLKSEIDKTIANAKKNEKQILINELIEECKNFDLYYKEYCDAIDEETGDPVGQSYENGISIEFYREAEDWHRISLIMRRLEELKNK